MKEIKVGRRRRCYVCGQGYADNKFGRLGKGGWRTCSPWCRYFDLAKAL